MQTAKQTLYFKHFSYLIELASISEKRLTIKVTDSLSKTEFFEKDLVLEKIGVSTMIRAFQKAKKELSFQIETKKGGQSQMIQIKIKVESLFLLPVQEIIYINKLRDVSEAEALKKSIDYLNKKMKDLRQFKEINNQGQVLAAFNLKEQHLQTAYETFQTLSEITLPKGRYVITWTFLAKGDKGLMYLYLNQNQIPLLANGAISFSNRINFYPFIFRKIHTVAAESQKMQLQTHSSVSYPSTIKNCIVTAKRLD